MEKPSNLWLQPDVKNDRATPQWIKSAKLPSLYLLKVENMTIHINNYDKHRARFGYNGISYDFSLTDLGARNKLDQSEQTHIKIEGLCYLCELSSTMGTANRTPSEEYHYKLVATIIEL